MAITARRFARGPILAIVTFESSETFVIRTPTPLRPLDSNSATGVTFAVWLLNTVVTKSSPRIAPAATITDPPFNFIPATPAAPRPWILTVETGILRNCPSEAVIPISILSGEQNALTTRSPALSFITCFAF